MAEAPHLSFSRKHVMIMCAPNGARRMPSDHPNLPITPGAIARAAAPLPDAGVSVLHLHVRDHNGTHSLDPDIYRQTIAAIGKEVGEHLIIQVTTEAVGKYGPDSQISLVRQLKPEAVSLAMRELFPEEESEPAFAGFVAWMKQNAIWPQYILYDPDELRRFERLRQKGFFEDDHPWCLFVLGNYVDGIEGTSEDLDAFLRAANCQSIPWSVCCFGQGEYSTMQHALGRGGHVRMGFENNLWLADGTLARDNHQLIEQFMTHLENHSRSPATATQLRTLLASN